MKDLIKTIFVLSTPWITMLIVMVVVPALIVFMVALAGDMLDMYKGSDFLLDIEYANVKD